MSAFGIFLMRQMMLSIPDEILDAARVDGAGEVRLFRHLVIPMTRAGFLVLGLLTTLTSWNDYLWPVIVLRSENMLHGSPWIGGAHQRIPCRVRNGSRWKHAGDDSGSGAIRCFQQALCRRFDVGSRKVLTAQRRSPRCRLNR